MIQHGCRDIIVIVKHQSQYFIMDTFIEEIYFQLQCSAFE